MARGKYQKRNKSILPMVLLLLALIALGSTTGGVAAYLSTSAEAPATNTFTVAQMPTVTVNGTAITVPYPGYDVYLRAAVSVNWKNNATGTLLGAKEAEYTLRENLGWTRAADGFYYYNSKIKNDISGASPVTVSTDVSKDGYTLVTTIAAQVIQAVGTTDTGGIDAVIDAWGVNPGT